MKNETIKGITGHQSFHLRKDWIPKAIRAIKKNEVNIFSGKNLIHCIDEFGLGSNMIKSLQYWLKILGVVTKIGKDYKLQQKYLDMFDNDMLLSSEHSIQMIHIDFCDNFPLWEYVIRKDKVKFFTRKELIERADIVFKEHGQPYDNKTLSSLVSVLINTFVSSEDNPEDRSTSPLAELNLLENTVDGYRFRMLGISDVLPETILYILLNKQPHEQITLNNAVNLITGYFHLEYYECMKIIGILEQKGKLAFDRAVGLNNIILYELPEQKEEQLTLF